MTRGNTHRQRLALAAGVIPHDEAIAGAVCIGLALAPFAHSQSVRARPTTHARAAERVHPFGKAIGITDARVAWIPVRELADAVNASASSTRVEDRALLVGAAMLVAALPKAALVPWLTVGNGHNANAIDAAVVHTGIIVLPAAAIPIGLTDAPARAVDTRFTVVAAAAGIQRCGATRGHRRSAICYRRAKRPSRHTASKRDGQAVKLVRIHAAYSA